MSRPDITIHPYVFEPQIATPKYQTMIAQGVKSPITKSIKPAHTCIS